MAIDAPHRDSWVRFSATLLLLTQKKEIVWRVALDSDWPESAGNEIIDGVVAAKVDGRTIRIYERKYERSESHLWSSLRLQRDGSSWREEIVLEVSDLSGDLWVRAPYVSGIKDLYRSAINQVADMDQFLNSFVESNG